MKSFFRNLSACFPFFVRRPSALERAVASSPKSRRLRMEPLENRALLAVDAFGVSASLAASNVEESWGPDPEPAVFSASVLATDAAIIDVSELDATSAAASFSVQAETSAPVAPPSFEQLMESLGMIEVESLGDESDVASLSFLDSNESAQNGETQEVEGASSTEPRQVVFYDSSAADFDASFLNVCEPNFYYIDTASSVAEATGVSSRSGGSGGDNATSFEITVNGSTQLSECEGFPSGGGIAESFFSVVVPYLGSTSRVLRVTPSTGSGAILNQDYMVVGNRPDVEGPAEPYAIGGGDYFDVSGGTTFYVVPLNESVIEAKEYFSLGLSVVEYGSGGGTVAELEPIAASIVDDDTFSLDSVKFRNHLNLRPDPTTTNWNPAPWTGPHWVKDQPAATLPVAYACTENAKISCEAAVSGETDSTCGYQLRAVWEYNGETFTTPWQPYYGETISVTFSDTFRNIFKGRQAYYDPNFTLTWEFKIVGEDTVREIDDSVNPLYVTYDAPSTSNLYHTVVHTGCKAASFQNTEIAVFHAIWDKFTSLNIKEVNVVNGVVTEGETLTYYGKTPENVASIPTIKTCLSVHDTGLGILHNYVATQFPSRAREYYLQYGNTTKTGTEILLVAHDGTCGFWQDFAIQVFNCQGLAVTGHDISADQYDGFKVLGELRGQGGGVPLENIWYNHAVIQYKNWILDPSYGVNYGTYDVAAQNFINTALESVGVNLSLEPDEYLGYGFAYKKKEKAGSIEIDDLYFSWL